MLWPCQHHSACSGNKSASIRDALWAKIPRDQTHRFDSRARLTAPPPPLCSASRCAENFWGQLGTNKLRLSAFSCATGLAFPENQTCMIAFIYSLLTHLRALPLSSVA